MPRSLPVTKSVQRHRKTWYYDAMLNVFGPTSSMRHRGACHLRPHRYLVLGQTRWMSPSVRIKKLLELYGIEYKPTVSSDDPF